MKIVGIGASAGGVEAISEFLRHLRTDTGAAFVLIQHLSPDHDSIMDELFQRQTEMKVQVVRKPTPVLSGNIYLIPNDKNLVFRQGMLIPEPRESANKPNLPIDLLFHSLGDALEDKCIGVILSGSGTDGSRGARTIKEKGGIVLVQSPQSAQFTGMPSSAIRLNIADKVDAPKNLAEILGEILIAKSSTKDALINLEKDETKTVFRRILDIVIKKTRIEFSAYQEPTILRRLENRMLLHRCSNLEDYLQLLVEVEEEADSLSKDFLIGVTRFFRNKTTFDFLYTHIIPRIVENKQSKDPIRIWISACSTGEEAYTFGILLQKYLTTNNISREFKIFASDVNRSAIEFATQGFYNHSIEADVPPEYLQKYFTNNVDGYRIVPELREKILFAVHDVMLDPPFIRMDFISCRNFLIYLKPSAQSAVLTTFHASLNKSGYLLLGPSESVGDLKNAYHKAFPKTNIYTLREDVRLPGKFQSVKFISKMKEQNTRNKAVKPYLNEPIFSEVATDPFTTFFVESFAPTAMFLNAQLDVLFINGNMDNILKIPSGLMRLNLTRMVNEENLMVFKNGVFKSLESSKKHIYKNIVFENGAKKVNTDLNFHAVELPSFEEKVILVEVIFKDLAVEEISADASQEIEKKEMVDEQIQMLRYELRVSRNRSQKLVSELEATNEELHASNRELLASNEELQSTNEELQSVNEELYTVNSEFQSKNEELTLVNNDINNLLKSIEIGTIFLDSDLRIRRFTPAIVKQFDIIQRDIGRPITNFSSAFKNLDIGKLSRKVFDSLKSIEREVSDVNGRHYLMRILPYRTEMNVIKGLVITFVEIEDLVTTRKSMEVFANRYNSILTHSEHILAAVSNTGEVLSINHDFGKNSKKDIIGKDIFDVLKLEDKQTFKKNFEKTIREKSVTVTNVCLKNHNEKGDCWYKISVIPETSSLEEEEEVSTVIVMMVDVSNRLRAEREIEISFQNYLAYMNESPYQIALVDEEGIIRHLNYAKRVNKKSSEMVGTNIKEYLNEEGGKTVFKSIQAIFAGDSYSKIEFKWKYPDGRETNVELFATPVIIKAGVKYVALVEYTERVGNSQ